MILTLPLLLLFPKTWILKTRNVIVFIDIVFINKSSFFYLLSIIYHLLSTI